LADGDCALRARSPMVAMTAAASAGVEALASHCLRVIGVLLLFKVEPRGSEFCSENGSTKPGATQEGEFWGCV
jgi:hypothetical protein